MRIIALLFIGFMACSSPAHARFVSVDPLAEATPGLSPYQYAGNNPLRNIEVAGMFWYDVHNEINQEALAGLFTKSEIEVVERASLAQDINTAKYVAEEHFDSEKFAEGWAFLDTQMKAMSLADLGKALHALQDFYSHSNYIELGTQFFGSEDKIPTFDEALQNKEFKALWEKRGTSGYYPDEKTPNKKLSHGVLNKDRAKGKSTSEDKKKLVGAAKKLACKNSEAYARKWKAKGYEKIKVVEPKKKDDKNKE